MSTVTLRVVVVSYNTRDLLRECLRSVLADELGATAEIVVVDNASADDSVAVLGREFPGVRVLCNEANLGYAAALNQALAGLTADYGLILNSDIEVHPGALQALLAAMAADARIGLAGPLLLLPDGRVQETWKAGFSLGEFACQQLLLDKLPCRRRRAIATATATAEAPPESGTLAVDHLHGAALLVRREALQEVGLLDEAYWMYCEDSDWCLRFRRAGWTLAYVPASRLLHHHGASSRQTRAEMIAAYNLAAARYFRLHQGALEGRLARCLGLLGTSLRFGGALLGAILTIGLYRPLSSRAKLFFSALAWQARWRNRWLQGECVPQEGVEAPRARP